ncbi:transposable element Tcb2 transposase [Trichonephila clavipes]|nr:transposable element Tcb2 transposase [Trichonephila clavipes]
MFSDESRFRMTNDSGHQLLLRERGTRYAQKFVSERDRYDPGVMVWAGIMHNGRTLLHIFERGIVTSQWYCREIILDNVRIYRSAVGSYFLFIDYNTWPHRSVEVLNTMQSKNILMSACLLFRPKSY